MFLECKNYPVCYKESVCPDCDGCSNCCNCDDENDSNKKWQHKKPIPKREKFVKQKTPIKSLRKGEY